MRRRPRRGIKYWNLCDDSNEELASLRLDVGGLRCQAIHEGIRLEYVAGARWHDSAPACIVPLEIVRDLAALSEPEVTRLIEWVRRNVPEL